MALSFALMLDWRERREPFLDVWPWILKSMMYFLFPNSMWMSPLLLSSSNPGLKMCLGSSFTCTPMCVSFINNVKSARQVLWIICLFW